MAQLIQGTWKEILLHTEDLRGQRDLVLIVPYGDSADASGKTYPYLSETLAALLEEGKSISPEASPNPTYPYEQTFGEVMDEKYRRMPGH